jgi:hypothetical protein
MREDDYKPMILDYSGIISMPSSGNYYVQQEWFDHLKELAQIYDITVITGVQKQKFTLGKLKLLNIV